MADEQDYEIEISEDAGFLRIAVRGKREFGRSQRLVALVRKTADERAIQRVLLDTRELTDPAQNKYRFALGELVAEQWQGLRVAVVNPVEARDGFVETVAVNRGVTFRIFETEDGALDWLRVR